MQKENFKTSFKTRLILFNFNVCGELGIKPCEKFKQVLKRHLLPFYLPNTELDLRFLRMFRLFRILRILNLVRYFEAVRIIGQVVYKKRIEFISILGILVFLMFYAES